MKIWKFTLELGVDQAIEMPEGAVILAAASQMNVITLWAEVDPAAPKVQRRFVVVGTGWETPVIAAKYLGTAITYEDVFVWHVFEIVE